MERNWECVAGVVDGAGAARAGVVSPELEPRVRSALNFKTDKREVNTLHLFIWRNKERLIFIEAISFGSLAARAGASGGGVGTRAAEMSIHRNWIQSKYCHAS